MHCAVGKTPCQKHYFALPSFLANLAETLRIMTRKFANIVSAFLIVFLCCIVFIPVGIRNGWTVIHIVTVSVIFIVAAIIACWDVPVTRPLRFDGMSKKTKALYWGSFFAIFIGLGFMAGLYGDGYGQLATGGVLLLAGFVVQRCIIKSAGDLEDL